MALALSGCVHGQTAIGLEAATDVCEVNAAEAIRRVSAAAVRPPVDGMIACESASQRVE